MPAVTHLLIYSAQKHKVFVVAFQNKSTGTQIISRIKPKISAKFLKPGGVGAAEFISLLAHMSITELL